MPDRKSVVMVTSGQPSLNPRLVKEADTLADNGYDVLVIYAYWNEWGTAMDDELLPQKKWRAVRVGGHPVLNKPAYQLSRVMFKLTSYLVKQFKFMFLADFALSRPGIFLEFEARKYEADIYIGHNLGALPAVIKAARKFNKPAGFDAEDLHRFETGNNLLDHDVKLKVFTENKYYPQTAYLTASSTQISKAYQEIFEQKEIITLLNVFPKNFQSLPKKTDKRPLKLFWFSQTIGSNRGIEDVIKAIQLIPQCCIELHLLGKLNNDVKNHLDKLITKAPIQLHFHNPAHPDKLVAFAAQFDIGLALEPAFSINNDLALSNKLFTYLQAGLAIIASSTTAQSAFMHEHPAIGKTYTINDAQSLSEILLHYHQNREQLLKAQQSSLNLAKNQLNWETESIKFLSLIEKTLEAAG